MRRQQAAAGLVAALIVLGILASGPGLTGWAADEPATPAAAAPAAATPAAATPAADAPAGREDDSPLSARQQILHQRYRQFEKTLLQMAEYMRKTDPDRADLLVRAIARSKEERISSQMEAIIRLLESNQLGDAARDQEELMSSLKGLLDLLQSENRLKDIEAEKARIRDLLKDLNKITGKEIDERAKTERGDDFKKLIESQGGVEKDTKKLVGKIDKQDAERNASGVGRPGEGKPGEGKPGEGKPGEGKPGEGKPGEGKPGEGKPGEGKPGEGKPGEGKPGEGKPGESKPGEAKPAEAKPGEAKPGEAKPGEGKPGEGKPGEGKPGEGKPGEGKPGKGKPGEGQPGDMPPGSPGKSPPPGDDGDDSEDSAVGPKRTPGRKELEQARKEMERAIEELKKANREGASKKQDDAIAKLKEAKEKLEEILRQLREEERELLLQALEARFQKMLALQLIVYNGTTGLDKTPKAEWNARHFARSRDLSNQETEISLEAAKAIELLKGEGSSVAFPEAVEQLREDILLVARRLERNDTGEITQAIERDIIESLEELIEALQKEMEKMKDKDKKPPPPKDGQPQDPSLVDKIAELKMLRSLQMRVNRRTKTLSREVEDGNQAEKPDILSQLQDLVGRQAKIQKATYDIAVGKNQ